METIRFRHAHFSARFPVAYRYTPAHYWLAPADSAATIDASGRCTTGLWRVGFTGEFLGTNPQLTAEACLTHSDPHGAGWLYEVRGLPGAGDLDVHAYVELLAGSIDRLQASRYSGGDDSAGAETPPNAL